MKNIFIPIKLSIFFISTLAGCSGSSLAPFTQTPVPQPTPDSTPNTVPDTTATPSPSPTSTQTVTPTATYTVTYNGNGSTGGSVPTDGAAYAAGSSITVIGNSGSLVKTGYIFSGWNTLSNGTGTTYAASSTFNAGSSNVTLYALWSVITYTVTYNINGATGGSAPTDSNAYATGATVTVLGNTGSLTLSGQAFAGWNTASDGSGTTYVTGATLTTASTNLTLYALWATARSVTYNGNGNTGGSAPTDSTAYATGSTVTTLGNSGTLTQAGYTFSGWNTAANGSGVSYASGSSFTMGSSSVTLYAIWYSNTATLSSLAFSINSVSQTLSPAFDSTTLLYTLSTACITTNPLVVTPSVGAGTISVAVGSATGSSVTSGNPKSLTLGGSNNIVNIKVTNGGVSNTYQVDVIQTLGTNFTCSTVGKWNLDEANGSTSFADGSGNSRALAGTSVIAGSAGFSGNAVTFGSTTPSYLYDSTDTINIPYVTVSAWVYPTSAFSGMTRIAGFSQGNGSGVYDKVLGIDGSGSPKFYVYSNNTTPILTSASSTLVPLNTWSHIVGVVDGLNVYTYLNGTLVGSASCGTTYTSYTVPNILVGGHDGAEFSNYFHGRIDGVGIWSIGFSSSDVQNLYQNGF